MYCWFCQYQIRFTLLYYHRVLQYDFFFFFHFNLGIRFQVKKKQFFRNFSTIMLFGALGTLISFVIISLGTAVYLVLVHTIHGFPLPLTNTPGS